MIYDSTISTGFSVSTDDLSLGGPRLSLEAANFDQGSQLSEPAKHGGLFAVACPAQGFCQRTDRKFGHTIRQELAYLERWPDDGCATVGFILLPAALTCC